MQDLLYPKHMIISGMSWKLKQFLKLGFVALAFLMIGGGSSYMYLTSLPPVEVPVEVPVDVPVPVSDWELFINETVRNQQQNLTYLFVVSTDIGEIIQNNVTIEGYDVEVTGSDRMCSDSTGFWQLKEILSEHWWTAWDAMNNEPDGGYHLSVSQNEYLLWSRGDDQIIELRYSRALGTLWEAYLQFDSCFGDSISIQVQQVSWW